MKPVLTLVILALLGTAVHADSPAPRTSAALPAVQKSSALDARARAALALAQRKRPAKKAGCPCGCSCGAACQCTSPGQCGDPACTCGTKAKKQTACPCGCGCTTCACTYPAECGNPSCTCGSKLAAKHALTLEEAADKAIRQNKPLLVWVAEVCPPCEKKMPGYIHVHVAGYSGYQTTIAEPSVLVAKPDGQGGLNIVKVLPGIPDVRDVQTALAPPRQVFLPPPPPPMPMFFGGFGGCGGGG